MSSQHCVEVLSMRLLFIRYSYAHFLVITVCRVVDHEHANKADHCTISLKGVTRMRSDDETEFVPLDRWEQEHVYFQKLVKVPHTVPSLVLISYIMLTAPLMYSVCSSLDG